MGDPMFTRVSMAHTDPGGPEATPSPLPGTMSPSSAPAHSPHPVQVLGDLPPQLVQEVRVLTPASALQRAMGQGMYLSPTGVLVCVCIIVIMGVLLVSVVVWVHGQGKGTGKGHKHQRHPSRHKHLLPHSRRSSPSDTTRERSRGRQRTARDNVNGEASNGERRHAAGHQARRSSAVPIETGEGGEHGNEGWSNHTEAAGGARRQGTGDQGPVATGVDPGASAPQRSRRRNVSKLCDGASVSSGFEASRSASTSKEWRGRKRVQLHSHGYCSSATRAFGRMWAALPWPCCRGMRRRHPRRVVRLKDVDTIVHTDMGAGARASREGQGTTPGAGTGSARGSRRQKDHHGETLVLLRAHSPGSGTDSGSASEEEDSGSDTGSRVFRTYDAELATGTDTDSDTGSDPDSDSDSDSDMEAPHPIRNTTRDWVKGRNPTRIGQGGRRNGNLSGSRSPRASPGSDLEAGPDHAAAAAASARGIQRHAGGDAARASTTGTQRAGPTTQRSTLLTRSLLHGPIRR